jgi:hypothetical protein
MAFAEQYLVSGAGNPEVNGVYTLTISNSWLHESGLYYIARTAVVGPPGLVTFYKINTLTGNVQGYQSGPYFPSTSTPYPDEATNWSTAGALFPDPVPTVTVYTGPTLSPVYSGLPDSLKAAIQFRFGNITDRTAGDYLRLKNLGYF